MVGFEVVQEDVVGFEVVQEDTVGRVMVETASLMGRLRAQTRQAHAAAEATAFARALVEETLPARVLLGQLAGYLRLHRVLEASLEASADPRVARVWRADLQARSGLIEDDLRRLGPAPAPRPQVASAVEALVRRVEVCAAARPVGLLGHLYVMEGATLGHLVVRRHGAAVLGVEPESLRYHTADGRQTRHRWADFSGRMDDIALSDDEAAQVVAEAEACFEGIERFLRAIYTSGAPG